MLSSSHALEFKDESTYRFADRVKLERKEKAVATVGSHCHCRAERTGEKGVNRAQGELEPGRVICGHG